MKNEASQVGDLFEAVKIPTALGRLEADPEMVQKVGPLRETIRQGIEKHSEKAYKITPDRFGSIEEARAFWQKFFEWYNTEHRHSGIAWLTSGTMHHPEATSVLQGRRETLVAAHAIHSERFVKSVPEPPQPPKAAWISLPFAAAVPPGTTPDSPTEAPRSD